MRPCVRDSWRVSLSSELSLSRVLQSVSLSSFCLSSFCFYPFSVSVSSLSLYPVSVSISSFSLYSVSVPIPSVCFYPGSVFISSFCPSTFCLMALGTSNVEKKYTYTVHARVKRAFNKKKYLSSIFLH